MAKESGRGWDQTHDHLQLVALELFERNGFESTTVAKIAHQAGMTEMTFFRHFGAKHGVLFDDPYDEVIAQAVAEQSLSLGPLARVVAGFRHAWRHVPEPDGDIVRRRVRVVAMTPSLRGEMWQTNAVTEALVIQQLMDDGTDRLHAVVAASAVLAVLSAALLEWSMQDDAQLGAVVEAALDVLGDDRG